MDTFFMEFQLSLQSKVMYSQILLQNWVYVNFSVNNFIENISLFFLAIILGNYSPVLWSKRLTIPYKFTKIYLILSANPIFIENVYLKKTALKLIHKT